MASPIATPTPADDAISILGIPFPTFPPSATPFIGVIGDYVWLDRNGDGRTDEPPTAGLNGVFIDLFLDKNCNGVIDPGDEVVAATSTSNDPVNGNPGWYLFADLPAQCYVVSVETELLPTGLLLTTANNPEPVYLITGLDFRSADFGFWLPARVSGAITSNGQALAGAEVTLFSASWVEKAVTLSDANGRYKFPAVAQGSYFVFAAGHDLPPTGYSGAYFGAPAPATNRDAAVPLNAFFPDHQVVADLDLVSGGAVSGCLRDEQGTPIPHALVIASGESPGANCAAVYSAATGCFFLGGLALNNGVSSAYVIYACDPQSDLATVYYDNADTRFEAKLITFNHPQEINGIDLVLPHTGSIAGSIAGYVRQADGGAPIAGLPVFAYRLLTPTPSPSPEPALTATPFTPLPFSPTSAPSPVVLVESYAGSATSDDQGAYVIADLLPGTYRLQALGDYAGWDRTYLMQDGAVEMITVAAGLKTVNKNIDLRPAGRIAGFIDYHGDYPGPVVLYCCTDLAMKHCVRTTQLAGAEPFTITALPYGSYYLEAVIEFFAPQSAAPPRPRGVYGANGVPAAIQVASADELWLGSVCITDPRDAPIRGGATTPTPTQNLIPPPIPTIVTQTPFPTTTNHLNIEIEGQARVNPQLSYCIEITGGQTASRSIVKPNGRFEAVAALHPGAANVLDLRVIDAAGNRSAPWRLTIIQDGAPPQPLLNFQSTLPTGKPSVAVFSGVIEEACSVCLRRLVEPDTAAVCHEIARGPFSFSHPTDPGERLVLWTVDSVGNRSVQVETVAGNQSDLDVAGVYEGEARGIAAGFKYADTYVASQVYYHCSEAKTTVVGITDEMTVTELNNHIWYGVLRGKVLLIEDDAFTFNMIETLPCDAATYLETTEYRLAAPEQEVHFWSATKTPEVKELWPLSIDADAFSNNRLLDAYYFAYAASGGGFTSVDSGRQDHWQMYTDFSYLASFLRGPWLISNDAFVVHSAWSENIY